MAASTDGWHENLRGESRTVLPSNRSFGFTLSSVLLALGAWTLWRGGVASGWELGGGALLLLTTLTMPGLLYPLNRLWSLIGELLQAIVSPTVMAILFYGVVTPIGVLLRSLGRDPLRRRIDHALQSYWITRPPTDRHQTSMKNQF